MKRIAISELEGAALDWAVAKAVGMALVDGFPIPDNGAFFAASDREGPILAGGRHFTPSTDWSQCGPLIELFLINISYWSGLGAEDPPRFRSEMAMHIAGKGRADGETPLIAACRAIVASHNPSGYVEVPDELVEVE